MIPYAAPGKGGAVWLPLCAYVCHAQKSRLASLQLHRAKSSKHQKTLEDRGPLRLKSLAVSPCPNNTTALLWEMEWGQAVVRWDIALTNELAVGQSHHNKNNNNNKVVFWAPKTKVSLSKNAYKRHSKIKLYTRNPYTSECALDKT